MTSRRPRSRSAPINRVLAAVRAARVRLVRFLYTDNGGITRGKATHVQSLASRMTDGIGLTVAMQAMNMLDQLTPVEGMGPVGEIRLVPDPATFTVLPYAPHAAAMTCDMLTLEGPPWDACPRTFLKRQIAACADERAFALLVVERTREWPLGSFLAEHVELSRRQDLPPLGRRLADLLDLVHFFGRRRLRPRQRGTQGGRRCQPNDGRGKETTSVHRVLPNKINCRPSW